MPHPRDWREPWIDKMGLILALSGKERFDRLEAFKLEMLVCLTAEEMGELKVALRQRFCPTNGAESGL